MKEALEAIRKQIHDLSELVKNNGSQEVIDKMSKDLMELMKSSPAFAGAERGTVIGVDQMDPAMLGKTPELRVEKVLTRMPEELQRKASDVFLVSKILQKNPHELDIYKEFRKEAKEHAKALDTAASGGGTEWIPTDFSPELWRLVRLATRVASAFPTIKMPTNPYKLPSEIGRMSTFKLDEQTADTGQTLINVADDVNLTSNRTLTAVGHGGRVLVSKEQEEDSIIPMLEWIREAIILGLAEGREDVILNGDTTGTHQDSDVTAAADRRKINKGLRKHAIAGSYTTDLSTFTYEKINMIRAKMQKYGVVPSDLFIVTGMAAFIKLGLLPECITIDKYGPNATILSGELGKLGGIPVIVSEWVREVLDATGVYSASGTKTVLHYVHRRGFAIGERRMANVQILREKYADSDQDAVQVKERFTFHDMFDATTNKVTWMGINVPTT